MQGSQSKSPVEPVLIISSAHNAERIRRIAWLPGDRIVTSSWEDGTVRIWNSTDGTQVGTTMVHESRVFAIAVTKDGRIVTSCDNVEHLFVWNADTQEPVDGPWVDERHGPCRNLGLSPNEDLLASDHERRIILWDMVGTMRVKRRIELEEGTLALMQALCFSSDNTRLAACTLMGFAIFDVESGDCIVGPLTGEWYNTARAVAWAPDGARIFLGYGPGSPSTLGKMCCFRSDTGEPIGERWAAHDLSLNQLSVSPDGKAVASCSQDSYVSFWDMESNDCIGNLSARSTLQTLAFSRSGEFIASASEKIFVWQVPRWEDDGDVNRKDLHELLDLSAAVSPVVSAPSNIIDDDFFRVNTARRRPVPLGDHSSVDPTRDPPNNKSAVSQQWWKKISRLSHRVPDRLQPISTGYAQARTYVAEMESVDSHPSSPAQATAVASEQHTPLTIVVEPSADSEENSVGASVADPEVSPMGCCGLLSPRRPRVKVPSSRPVDPLERSSHRPRIRSLNNSFIPEPTPPHPVKTDILEFSGTSTS